MGDTLVPDTESVSDYASNMLESLKVLAEVENRSQIDVYRDLANAGLDIMRAIPTVGLRDDPPFHPACVEGVDLEKASVVLNATSSMALRNGVSWTTDDSEFPPGVVLEWFERLSSDDLTLNSASRLLRREIALSDLTCDLSLNSWESVLRCPCVFETVEKTAQTVRAMLSARAVAKVVADKIESDPSVWAPPRDKWLAASWDEEGNETSGDSLRTAKTTAVGWAFKVEPHRGSGEMLLWLMAHLTAKASGPIRREDGANVVAEWEKEEGRTALDVASLFRGAEVWLSPRPQ